MVRMVERAKKHPLIVGAVAIVAVVTFVFTVVDQRLRMFVHETEEMTVRAVFDGDSLEMYAVTLMNDTLSPSVNWLGQQDFRLDWDSASELARTDTEEGPYDPVMVERFRSASNPNTYGEFRDDGGYGQVVRKLFVTMPSPGRCAFHSPAGVRHWMR